MEDLREVGQKAIESVNKLKKSDAGDLVLGIGEIIEELREKPKLYQEKLDHLEGLFREFAYGEGYKLRNNRVDILEEYITQTMSGCSPRLSLSGTFPQNNSVAGISPVVSSPDQDDVTVDEEEKVEKAIERALGIPETVLKEKPKPFKKRWWNRKA